MNIKFNPVILIKKKRDGLALTAEEWSFFITGLESGDIPNYQMSALLMASFLQGLNKDETYALTHAMLHSGKVIPSDDKTMVDKHSTGGVGDKTSFILGPLARACGAKVPMVTGRGLGHTGGTVDKAESIPGLKMDLHYDEFIHQLNRDGLVIAGQSEDVAPADGKIYALRDVTGTVESIPLVTASILSKKLAEGIHGLVLDIKVGSGAFFKKKSEAKALAKSLIRVTKCFGKNAVAIITNMNQPLGHMIGNSVEIMESIETLKGNGPKDLTDLSVELAAQMVLVAGKSKSLTAARKKVKKALNDGSGLEIFQSWVTAQGGPKDLVDKPEKYLPLAEKSNRYLADRSGYIKSIATADLGQLIVELGGGRMRSEDKVDPSVGIKIITKIGDKVKAGDPILEIYHHARQADLVRKILTENLPTIIQISKRKPKLEQLIIDYVE